MIPTLLLVLLLAQTEGTDAPSPGSLPDATPSPVSSFGGWRYLTRVEIAALALLPRGGTGEREVFAQVEPTLIFDGGEGLGLNIGAPVRLRLAGGIPGAGFVRIEDWDSLSDFGQLVRAFKLGSYASHAQIRAGALEDYSLLSGHLVRRYSNRMNPDYHPAGGVLTATAGPLYLEAFASDVLGARLTGAEFELDVGSMASGLNSDPGRYTLSVSAMRDWGRAEAPSPAVTLAHMDGRAVVFAETRFEFHLLAG